jgi:hypothetical protein
MRHLILAGLVVALVVPSLAWAASVANPAAVVTKENYGFTMEVENQKVEIDNDLTESRRYLGKAIWGATDRLDFYVKLGVSDLKVYTNHYPDFRGQEKMTYGGGIRYLLAQAEDPDFEAFIDFQGLGFSSPGSVWLMRADSNNVWLEKHYSDYDWREFQLSFFAAWKRDIWQPYIGFALLNVRGKVSRDLYIVDGDVEMYQASGSDKFSEGTIPQIVVGSDFALGGSGRLSGELKFSQGQISFFVGLSELWH